MNMIHDKKRTVIEICCGSYHDALEAYRGGVNRIELNSALVVGGLTPTTATLKLIKAEIPQLKVICMVRPRGAGFCYTEEEFRVMEAECRELLEAGADGIAFGCLREDATLDYEKNKSLLSLIKSYNREVVFHRAFDCVSHPFETMEELISLGVDRVLTSGLREKAIEGKETIRQLQERFGDQIEILAGSGVNASNAKKLMEETGIYQVHSSCKDWVLDPTTKGEYVSYSIATGEWECMYDVVSSRLVKELLASIS